MQLLYPSLWYCAGELGRICAYEITSGVPMEFWGQITSFEDRMWNEACGVQSAVELRCHAPPQKEAKRLKAWWQMMLRRRDSFPCRRTATRTYCFIKCLDCNSLWWSTVHNWKSPILLKIRSNEAGLKMHMMDHINCLSPIKIQKAFQFHLLGF